MNFRSMLFAATACTMLTGAGAHAVTVNFDDVTGGSSFPAPVDVSTHYAALGVTFSDAAGPSGVIVASAIQVTPISSPNVFFANQHQADDSGDLQINFSGGTKNVSLTTYQSSSYSLFYSAYDASNALIVSGSVPSNPNYNVAEFLSLNEPTAIYRLALTSHPNYAYFGNFSIDDLTFDGTAVPEPASWALMFLGLGLTGGVLRQNRRANTATA